MPHGGPHSACHVGWSQTNAFLAANGFATLMVNYRGSTGFGDSALLSLLGKCGRQDVDDCVAALVAALTLDATPSGKGGKGGKDREEEGEEVAIHSRTRSSCRSLLDPQRVAVLGGSHGGFLTCHLMGQRPDLFAAGACRNPVVNLAAEVRAKG